MNSICFDTETTGLHPNGSDSDEILTISIIGRDGSVLLDDRFRPTVKTEWPHASAVNGSAADGFLQGEAFQQFIFREKVQGVGCFHKAAFQIPLGGAQRDFLIFGDGALDLLTHSHHLCQGEYQGDEADAEIRCQEPAV